MEASILHVCNRVPPVPFCAASYLYKRMIYVENTTFLVLHGMTYINFFDQEGNSLSCICICPLT